jgi:hypothetical protein
VLPPGPVAAPVVDASFNSEVRVEVVPLGGVGYDGQVLPLVSPDGRFLASQEGTPPTWPTLLAAPGAEAPRSTRIVVYDISSRPARIVPFAERPVRGLVLGRACDDAGFLVEAPQADGSRWIGRIQWASGSLEWLMQDSRVNAHAVFTPAGSVAWIARGVGSDAGELVLRAADGSESSRSGDGSRHLFPIASPEPGILCSLAQTAAGLELLAYSIDTEEAGGPERLGSIVSRALVAPRADAALAYQVAAPSSPVLPRRSAGWDGQRPVIFHPGFGRMAEFDRARGGLVLLPEGSIAAARAMGATTDGWFVTTPEGLMFSPDAARREDDAGRVHDARVLAEPFVPRPTNDPERPLILLGPMPRDPLRLQVMALRFAAPAPAGG